MTRPSRYPVSSFGAELLEALIRGAKERVEIPCPNDKTMSALQYRLHMLRSAMRKEGHAMIDLVSKARTSRTKNAEGECILVIQPNDAQFTDILHRANIVPTENARDILDESTIPAQPGDPTIAPTPPDESHINPYKRFTS